MSTNSNNGCETPDECDWIMVRNWEGDPGVVNGVHSWEEYHCRTCGAEVMDRPDNYHEVIEDDFDLD